MATDTEEKILVAARKIFKQKGFSAARTRDIANEAGVNLALLNYYYKSKECLFNEVMMEAITEFRDVIIVFLNDDKCDFMTNLQKLVDRYIMLWIEEPDLPLFVLNGLRNHQNEIIERINPRGLVVGSAFEKQMIEFSNNPSIDTNQIFINIISMLAFPFIGKSMVQNLCGGDDKEFYQMIERRKKLIPVWIRQMIKSEK